MAQYRYLDLSTGHIPEATMEWLSEAVPTRSHCDGLTIAPYEYGAFVSVPGESETIEGLNCPEDLKVVLRHARGLDCDVVRLDVAAEQLAELQHFDW